MILNLKIQIIWWLLTILLKKEIKYAGLKLTWSSIHRLTQVWKYLIFSLNVINICIGLIGFSSAFLLYVIQLIVIVFGEELKLM